MQEGKPHVGSSPTGIRTVVFRPLQTIKWPDRCLNCMAEDPKEKLTLDVFPATKRSTSAKVGGLAGGAFGASLGNFAGAIASTAAGETGKYLMPICRACLSKLPDAERKALARRVYRMVTSSPRIETQILSREFTSWRVVLTFANSRYAAAFRSANPGLVFDTVEASKSPKPTDSTAVQEGTAAKLKEPTKDKCKRCGQEMVGDDWVCHHCGRLDWFTIVTGTVLCTILVVIGAFVCNPGFWRWLWIGIGAILGVSTACKTVQALTWSKKRKPSGQQTTSSANNRIDTDAE